MFSQRAGVFYALMVCLVLVLSMGRVSAQSVSDGGRYVPQPWYGVDDDEFWIGGWVSVWDTTNGISGLWGFWESLGMSTLVQPSREAVSVDSLAWTAGPGQRMIITTDRLDHAGYGGVVPFYLFDAEGGGDTAQSPYYVNKFYYRDGGATALNPDPSQVDDYGRQMKEQVYDSATTTPGQVVADDMVFDWDSRKVYRFPQPWHVGTQGYWDIQDSVQRSDQFFTDRVAKAKNMYPFRLVVQGHLFSPLEGGGSSAAGDTLLCVEILQEVAKGESYRANTPGILTAAADTEFTVSSFCVTKGDLESEVPEPNRDPEDWSEYQESVHEFDPVRLAPPNQIFGLGPGSNLVSRRMNIRVRWMGGEKVAVRSIELRDSLGHRVVGSDAESEAWRQVYIDGLRRMLYGPSLSPDSVRRSIMAGYCAEEMFPLEAAGYAAVEKVVKDTFNFPSLVGGGRDSLPLWSAQTYAQSPAHVHAVQGASFAARETYLNDGRDTALLVLPADTGKPARDVPELYGVPHHMAPSIAEHNGGRFHVPRLELTPQAVDDYSVTLNRSYLGYHRTEDYSDQLWFLRGSSLQWLGEYARISRETGRRMVGILSANSHTAFRLYTDTSGTNRLDTLISHIPERAELKLLWNLNLAYGAKGVGWWWIGSIRDMLNAYIPNGGDTIWYGESHGAWGPVGVYLDTTSDMTTSYSFTSSHSTQPHEPRVVIDSFYCGFGVRSRALRWLHTAWTPTVEPWIMRLRWRDAYSIHQTLPRALEIDTLRGWRPLPSDEIVTEVTARSPWSSQDDPTTSTFVELGLFDTWTDSTNGVYDPTKDTVHFMVVNRRTFERPDDVDPSSPRGRLMDTLAETRIITLKLNMPNPLADSSGYEQYAFIRVQEVVKDTTTPALYSSAPAPLDTIVTGEGSEISITVPPGGMSLLRVTYMPPDSSFIAGDIRFNNGKKLVYSGNRYYSVYTRYQGPESSSFFDTVYCRRSFPMSDPAGSIIWEPVEHAVSLKHIGFDTARWQNRFPSLTVRARQYDTAVTVTWSCEQAQPFASQREIVMRDLVFWYLPPTGGQPAQNGHYWTKIQHVDWYAGEQRTQWGTPVVSSLDAGEVVAWSDSLTGIEAVFRAHNNDYTAGWPLVGPDTPILSPVLPVSLGLTQQYGSAGQYPTVAAYGNRWSSDSGIGIAWQQDVGAGSLDIVYDRVRHDSTVFNGLRLWNTPYPPLYVTQGSGVHLHPSITLIQRPEDFRQEVLVWESVVPLALPPGIQPEITVQELGTPPPGFTSPSGLPSSLRYHPAGVARAYPSASSLNSFDSCGGGPLWGCTPWVSIAFNNGPWESDLRMYQSTIDGGSVNLWAGLQPEYTYGGYHPATAESSIMQEQRQAVLYQNTPNPFTTPGVLRTTREFFTAKYERPTGYVADARSTAVMVDDSLRVGFSVDLVDVWQASATGSGPLELVAFDEDTAGVDDLGELADVMRTAVFSAGDSTVIGMGLYGRAFGAGLGSAWVDVVAEVVDSVSGSAVAVLDSFRLSSSVDSVSLAVNSAVDLVSGRYYVRLRLDTGNLTPAVVRSVGRRYTVADAGVYVADEQTGKRSASMAVPGAPLIRVSAQPNPFGDRTEVRYTIPEPGRVTVTAYDEQGRVILHLVDGEMTEPGRYAVGMSGAGLAAGRYLVEVRLERGGVVRGRSVVPVVILPR